MQQKWDKVSKKVAQGILKPDLIRNFKEIESVEVVDRVISNEEKLVITDMLFKGI